MEVREGAPQPVREEEVITEENVYDKYDEPMGFFPTQVLVDLTSSAILLAVTVALSYLIPTLVFILFFAIPWLDREPVHSPLRRPFVTVVAFLVILVVVTNMILAIIRIANFPGGSP
jgi:quinol-cytochrome oxidoreductase complex cytochrome b subunit